MWEDVDTSFWVANETMKKKVKNYRGLRWPPMNKSHTTINKKHAGAMKEGKENRFDWHGVGGEVRFDCFGDDSVGRGVKKLK